jgi:hypothetical protein
VKESRLRNWNVGASLWSGQIVEPLLDPSRWISATAVHRCQVLDVKSYVLAFSRLRDQWLTRGHRKWYIVSFVLVHAWNCHHSRPAFVKASPRLNNLATLDSGQLDLHLRRVLFVSQERDLPVGASLGNRPHKSMIHETRRKCPPCRRRLPMP